MTTPKSQFTGYIDDQLEQRGWNLTDLAERTGLASSVIFRYRRGYRPSIDNARSIAHTLEVPLLDVLVASGVLTQEEAHHSLSEADQRTVLSTVSTVTLAKELLARAQAYEQVQREYDAQQADLSLFASTMEQLKRRTEERDSHRSVYLTRRPVIDPDTVSDGPDEAEDVDESNTTR